MYSLLKMGIFHCHVSLPECILVFAGFSTISFLAAINLTSKCNLKSDSLSVGTKHLVALSLMATVSRQMIYEFLNLKLVGR